MVIAPPGQAPGQAPGPAPGGAPGSAADALALFAEARRRRRRRRVAGAVVTLAAAGLLAAGLTGGGSRPGQAHRVRPAPRPATILRPAAPAAALPPAHLAWVDYSGRLHIGDVATGAQHVVATFPSVAGGWFAVAAGHLFWLDFNAMRRAPIRDYDLATGKIRYLPRGQSVVASADGRHVYIMRSSTALTELRADGSGAPRPLTVPEGWHLDFPQPVAVAGGGITVLGNGHRADAFSTGIAIWYPRTGQLRRISTGGGIIAGYTPRHGGHSLLAWEPARCPHGNCMIKITNTGTLATITVHSPLRHGFAGSGGGFSPDGTQFAAFARRRSLAARWPSRSELALIDTRTGRLRVIRAVKLVTEEDSGWVRWLPGGRRLLAGALSASFAVDARTLAARPFFFFPGADDHDIMDTPDINFSTVVITPAQARRALRASR